MSTDAPPTAAAENATSPVAATPLIDLAKLHRSEYRSLVQMAAMMVNSQPLAEEIVQDVFVEVVRRPLELKPDTAPNYLRRAVANRARSALRKRRNVPFPATESESESAASAESSVLHASGFDALLAGIARLPLRQRQVLVVRYFMEYSIAETADILGVSAAAVTTSTHRALRALAHLKEELR